MTQRLKLTCVPRPGRFRALLASALVLTGVAITITSPAKADWTERRGGCEYTCHWYLAGGTCTGPFGVRVPCPLKKKRCAKDFCTSVSH